MFTDRVEYGELGGGGSVYEGQWNDDGKRHGRGCLFMKDGAKYVGEFSNGFFQGSGVLSYPDGAVYEGTFQLGKFQGYGVYRSQEGMKYEGQFEEGHAAGLGLVTFPDGSHGQPPCEGKFRGGECVERRSCGDVARLARQAAASARALLQS